MEDDRGPGGPRCRGNPAQAVVVECKEPAAALYRGGGPVRIRSAPHDRNTQRVTAADQAWSAEGYLPSLYLTLQPYALVVGVATAEPFVRAVRASST